MASKRVSYSLSSSEIRNHLLGLLCVLTGGGTGGGVSSQPCFSCWSVYQESVQPNVSGQRASPAVAGGQAGAEPAAPAGVAAREGGADARAFFSRVVGFFSLRSKCGPKVHVWSHSSLYLHWENFNSAANTSCLPESFIRTQWTLLPVTGLRSAHEAALGRIVRFFFKRPWGCIGKDIL